MLQEEIGVLFFVWSARDDDFHLERIHVDSNFWITNMYPKLRHFYYNCMLPELATPRHQSGQPVREVVDNDE